MFLIKLYPAENRSAPIGKLKIHGVPQWHVNGALEFEAGGGSLFDPTGKPIPGRVDVEPPQVISDREAAYIARDIADGRLGGTIGAHSWDVELVEQPSS